jgi:hypothetical protein
MAETTEFRIEIPVDELAVLDGYCSATGKTRTGVIRSLLGIWAKDKAHEAMMICRVAGINPTSPDSSRLGQKASS